MDAIILAAGLGTRLRPHTLTTPKPLLPIRGRPILDWTLAALPKVYSEGVTCDVCHKIRNLRISTEKELTASGIDKMELARPGPGGRPAWE